LAFILNLKSSAAGGLNSIMLGLSNEPAWRFGTYGNITQNRLFEVKNADNTVSTVDLLGMNNMQFFKIVF
jgi:hypothetical protein